MSRVAKKVSFYRFLFLLNKVPEQCIDGHLLPRNALLQHVIGKGGEAEEGLQDGIHVAGVSQVRKSAIFEIVE